MKTPTKFLKLLPFAILTLMNAFSLSAHARGGMSGGGGDASEIRVDEIRVDLLKWIAEGGAQGLALPPGMTLSQYEDAMSSILTPHAVVVGFVTTAQEAQAQHAEDKVEVDGRLKTCRGFLSERDGRDHILCNVERFAATSASDQYQLVHHEYAGLAMIEKNVGASSDYVISNQLSDFLVSQTVLRLSVKKTITTPVKDNSCNDYGPSQCLMTTLVFRNRNGFEVTAVGYSQDISESVAAAVKVCTKSAARPDLCAKLPYKMALRFYGESEFFSNEQMRALKQQ